MNVLTKLTTHRSNNQPVYIAFFDISSAYDNVDRLLLRKLLKLYNVLTDDQIALWEYLATAQSVRLGSETV
jgi:hypothetical protein